MPKLIDLTGKKFGKLAVLSRQDVSGDRWPRWLVRCDCGKKLTVRGQCLRRGQTTSCGACGNRGGRVQNHPLNWPAEQVALLGNIPDEEVAALRGCSIFAVRWQRSRRGIRAFKRLICVVCGTKFKKTWRHKKTCSLDCREELHRVRQRNIKRRYRAKRK